MDKKNSQIMMLILLILGLITVAAMLILKGNVKNQPFYEGTKINGISVGGKTVEEAQTVIGDTLAAYELKIVFRDEEQILTGESIDLKLNESYDLNKIKQFQNEKKIEDSTEEDLNLSEDTLFVYDEQKLEKQMMAYQALDEKKMVNPEMPIFSYDKEKKQVVLKAGKAGNRLTPDAVIDYIQDVILRQENTADIEASGLYAVSALDVNSDEAKDLLKQANEKLKIELSYTFADGKEEKISKKILASWMMIDEQLQFAWNHDAIQEEINQWIEAHQTSRVHTLFKTTNSGNIEVNVPVGGQTVDPNLLFEDILASLDEGKSATKEAPFNQETASQAQNFGGNYIEVDLNNQKLYLYKKGSLIMSSDIVSGSVADGHRTPTGVYSIYSMEKNVILRGADYASPVTYWMPFNGGVGFHDATWRGSFGGSIYKYNGSHGCINMPKSKAQALYENVNTGYRVIVFGGSSYVPKKDSESDDNKKDETKKETNSTKKPETSKPETSKPETSKPETSKPETSAPEPEKPETSKPETSAPETSAPETEKPETSKPETSAPEPEKPEPESEVG